MKKKRLAIFASGRGSNAQAIYDAIAKGTIAADIVHVLCDQPHAGIIQKAKQWGIPCTVLERKKFTSTTDYEEAVLAILAPLQIEGIVLAGFMRLLGSTFLTAYSQRILNIHPALLPAFTGLHAQRQAIERGVRYSGCTVHFVDAGMDTGPIILQAVVPVLPNDTEASLSARILKEEHRIYPEAVRLFCENRLRIEGVRVHIQE